MSYFFSNYVHFEYPMAATQLIFAMLGMGLTLSLNDFKGVLRTPTKVLYAATLQFLLLPLLTYAFTKLTGMPTGFALGFMLLVFLPGGSVSNIMTFLGRGHTALSITMTCIFTLLSLLTIPLLLKLIIAQHVPPHFEMPLGQVLRDIFLFLLAPLSLGMFIASRYQGSTRRWSQWCIRLSLLVLLCIVVGSLGSGRIQIRAYGLPILGLTIIFCYAIYLLSYGLASAVKSTSRADVFAISIEMTMRNINLGVLVYAILFPAQAAELPEFADQVLFIVLFYGGVSLFSSPLFAMINYKMTKPVTSG